MVKYKMRRTVRRARKTARKVRSGVSKMSKKAMRRSSKKTRKPTKKKKKKGKKTAWQKHVAVTYKAMKKVNPSVNVGQAAKAAAKTYKKGPKFTSLSMSSVSR